MFKMLIAWRFLLGIGIGAEYPSGVSTKADGYPLLGAEG
jgi:MFS family permease